MVVKKSSSPCYFVLFWPLSISFAQVRLQPGQVRHHRSLSEAVRTACAALLLATQAEASGGDGDLTPLDNPRQSCFTKPSFWHWLSVFPQQKQHRPPNSPRGPRLPPDPLSGERKYFGCLKNWPAQRFSFCEVGQTASI